MELSRRHSTALHQKLILIRKREKEWGREDRETDRQSQRERERQTDREREGGGRKKESKTTFLITQVTSHTQGLRLGKLPHVIPSMSSPY